MIFVSNAQFPMSRLNKDSCTILLRQSPTSSREPVVLGNHKQGSDGLAELCGQLVGLESEVSVRMVLWMYPGDKLYGVQWGGGRE